eukprot:jgi/Psemu1/59470/gm1.59470_g
MSYRELFQGPGPFGEAPVRHDIYQAIYTLFTEAEGAQLLPLLLDIFNAQAIGGLGIFQEDAAGVDRLRVIHGLRRYPVLLAISTTPSAGLGNPPLSQRLGSPTPLPSPKPGSPPPSHLLGSRTPPLRTKPASPPLIEPSSFPPIDLLGPPPPIDLLGPPPPIDLLGPPPPIDLLGPPPALASLAFPPCPIGSPSATTSYPRDRLDKHITRATSVYRH